MLIIQSDWNNGKNDPKCPNETSHKIRKLKVTTRSYIIHQMLKKRLAELHAFEICIRFH